MTEPVPIRIELPSKLRPWRPLIIDTLVPYVQGHTLEVADDHLTLAVEGSEDLPALERLLQEILALHLPAGWWHLRRDVRVCPEPHPAGSTSGPR
jgi:hypothetical protein